MTGSHPHTAEKTIITLMIRISLTMEAGIVLIPHLRTAIILSDERYTPKDTLPSMQPQMLRHNRYMKKRLTGACSHAGRFYSI